MSDDETLVGYWARRLGVPRELVIGLIGYRSSGGAGSESRENPSPAAEGSMSDAIQPALTPEEWSGRLLRRGTAVASEGVSENGAGRRGLATLRDGGGDPAVWWCDEDRHALAALALHGQPFGFTHADVALLRRLGRTVPHPMSIADPSESFRMGLAGQLYPVIVSPDDARRARDLADRIAALLSPEVPNV